MLSWRRVALTFSLRRTPPQDQELSNYGPGKNAKQTNAPSGDSGRKLIDHPWLPIHRGALGGKHDVLIKGNPGCLPHLTQFLAVLAPHSATGDWGLGVGTLEPALLPQAFSFSFCPGWASVIPSTLLPWFWTQLQRQSQARLRAMKLREKICRNRKRARTCS